MDWEYFGNDWAVRLLQQQIANKQVRHAYLISGPQNVGKRTLALRFSQSINCTGSVEASQYCGECQSCLAITRMQYPDLTICQPEKENGAIKVEDIRDFLRIHALSPYSANRRIGLLLRFHQATTSAQNALLKTLEEAPERVILILTADSPESLLPTIVSRCEVIRLSPSPVEQVFAALQKMPQISAVQAQILANLSCGRYGRALVLHEKPELLAEQDQILEKMVELLQGSRQERIRYVEKLGYDREKIRNIFVTWQSFWRDILLSAADNNSRLVHLALKNKIHELADEIGLYKVMNCITALDNAIEELDGNINTRLLAENLLIQWPITHK